ncbi:hypothetical protein NQ314_013368 [Rhamnusium bicolor]|uniref:Muscle M-line assembly protein unc-89 n=1 Tax=Rhamnusium bicolor TaxID=1586634 RepID=A0AAV8X7A1_9CUCU|nr:hypothetical protein NQ314_013368 [Rhamnusium bicolor]
MNSALKPVLTTSSQNPTVANQINKPMHPQGAPASYGQPSGHMTQNPYPNMNVAHNHPNAQANHFSLNVPTATPHFMGGNMGSIPPSNHPVANMSQSSTGQIYNPPKNVTYSSGYQPNLGHPPNQNTLPPVSQTLPATSPPQQNSSSQNSSNSSNSSTPTSEVSADKPQSNGTPEVKSPPKTDNQGIHVASTKDKPPTPVPSQVPQVSQAIEKPAEKPKPIPSVQEQKPSPEPAKVPEESKASTPTPTPPTTEANVSSTAASSTNTQPEPVSSSTKSVENTESSTLLSEKENKIVPVPIVTPDIKSAPQKEKTPIPQEISETNIVSEVDKDIKSKEVSEKETTSDKSASESTVAEPVQIASTTVPIKPKEQSPKKEPSPLKLATTPRTPTRKSKTPKPEESPKTPKPELKPPVQKSPTTGKAKRQRIRTQPYQSPLPEIEIITKISSSIPRSKHNDEKLIYFYKNEFLAVRNAEGGFYLCQAVQNIYKSSSKIKIRWLSQDKNDKSGEIYTPDFYDLTDFDCILTSLDLSRVDKGRYRLSPAEKERTDSILKRCLAVEKGEISTPSLSEEHPDGLDLSLYKDEEQLKKRKGTKRKGRSTSRSPKKQTPTKKSPESPKVRKVEPRTARKVEKKAANVVKKAAPVETKKATTSSSRAARGKRKSDPKRSPVMDHKKAKVLAKIGRKTAITVSATRPQSTVRSK